MPTQSYLFDTPTNYTYPAAVEVTGGQAALTSLDTPTVFTEDFNDAAGLTFGALVEISGGAQAQLALQDNAGQSFNEDFADDTDFTYNAADSEFTGGLVRQIQKTYKGSPYYTGTFFADYDTDINGNYGNGVLTGTATGGASVSGSKLDLTGGTVKYVDYAGAGNGDTIIQTGCIRFKYTPNYNGTPATSQVIFEMCEGNVNNQIYIIHTNPTGVINAYFRSNVGVLITSINTAVWNPTSGTEYEIEVNFDFTVGNTRVFVDGTLIGSDLVTTGTRGANTGRIRFGSNNSGTATSNFSIADFMLFDTVQNTANFVPSAYGLADPQYPTFYASFDEDVNGDWGDGVLTGTASGGASISGNELDLNYGDVRYVDYAAAGNSDSQQTGCIRFKYTPNYSGNPAAHMVPFIICEAHADSTNGVWLMHRSDTGNLIFYTMDDSDVSNSLDLGNWNPTASTEYEFELNYDFTSGAQRLFIDGNQHGGTATIAITRSAAIGLLRVGTGASGAGVSNFSINDVLFFDHVQHTANYTPDWSDVLPYEYYGDLITLPTMTYAGIGALQSFTNLVSTEANAPRYIMNGLWWSGAAWVASSNTWATANPIATVLANIATLPASDTMVIDVVTNNSIGTQQSASDLTLTYTGQIYPTSNPTIDIDAAITATATGQGVSAWNNFTHSVTETGGDTIRFVLSDDNGVSWKYWDGAAWSVSSGFAQSNSGTLIDTNIGSFPTTAAGIKIRIYLHSDTGATTPNIGNLVVNYDDYIYSTLNPTLYPVADLGADGLTSFAGNVTQAGSDTITFTIEVDGTEYYWSGAAWVGTGSFANSNTIADINTNAATLDLSLGANIRFIAYLHSNDGSTTPSIQDITVVYDFYNAPDVLPTPVIVSGFLRDPFGDPIASATVSVRPSRSFVPLGTDSFVFREWITTTTDASGYYEFSITPSASVEGDPVLYDFKFTVGANEVDIINKTAPAVPAADFSDL